SHLHRWAHADGGVSARDRVRDIDGLFSLEGWNEEETKGRWDLLVEARLVEEAWRDRWGEVAEKPSGPVFGNAMAFDHRAMLADAPGDLRLRMKREARLAHALCPPEFRLSELQSVYETTAGRRLYRSNFRRAMYHQASLVEPSGKRVHESKPG